MGIRETIKKNKVQLALVFIAFFLMVLTSSCFSTRIVEKQLRSDVDKLLSSAEMSISYRMSLANIALENAAAFMQESLNKGKTKKEIFNDFQELSGLLLQQLSGQISPTDFYGYVNGEFISSSGKDAPDVEDPMELIWYNKASGRKGHAIFFRTCNSGPVPKPVITAARQLRGWYGESYGVIAIDLDVSLITQSVAMLNIKDDSYGWLLDSDLTVLASTNSASVGKRINVNDELKSELMRDDSGEGTFTSASLISGDSRAAVFNTKKIDEYECYLVITTPTESYYAETYRMTAVLSVLGLVFMLILSYLLIHLSMEKSRSDEENKSKSSFLAKMSHEIRTPLNSILSMSELIIRRDILPEAREYISIINQSAKTLLSIINDILDFSKIESGRLEIENRKYHFSSMINDLINVIRLRLSDKQIDFFVSTDPNIPEELIGDDIRVRQIVSNLLTNAVKYTEKGAISLDVRTGRREDQSIELIFEVKDSGVGIKKENISKLFMEFNRFGKTQCIEGTGLGLVIARAYCARMGGTISVESRYRKGSTFTANVIQAFEDDSKSAFVEHHEAINILIFEPNAPRLKAVTAAMTALGLRPSCAMTQAEFMDMLDECRCDYAFVSSKYAMECIAAFGGDRLSTKLVVMLEIGDISAFKDVRSVMLPAYAIPIASVLNGAQREGEIAGSADKEFSAPDATVLVVDDLVTNLKVAKEVIAHFGLSVDTCISGKEAVNLVSNNKYDIVFMDHMMPEMDGLEATEAIRAMGKADEYYLSLPIVALTANAISGQKEMFLNNGMDDFLSKPIEMNKLVSVLKKWIPKEKQIETASDSCCFVLDQIGGFSIAGIDVAAGFKNTGRSMPVYKDILMDFCRDANDVIVQLKKAEQEDDAGKYAILAHSLKGAARSVGAMELAQSAAFMEEHAKAGNLMILRSRMNALWEDVRVLIENIYISLAQDALISDDGGRTNTQTPKLQASDLKIMKESLVNMDISTVNDVLVKFMTMPLDAPTKALISEIEQDVLLFDYGLAIEKIDRLL
ncbi:MAG: response regulator [Synergistaceae bacterium]|jgi:signal transduction histidine kinase/CheY-like chemotaxis protein/HPt (histidine-containing phosphotransfer) domain-containing protein|nr:response regulator [Synergistaceae bacterium]